MAGGSDRCVRCGHPREEGALLVDRMLYGVFSFPFVDHRTHCALCYEQLGWRAYRVAGLVGCAIVMGLALGAGHAPIAHFALLGAVVYLAVIEQLATSTRERITERTRRDLDAERRARALEVDPALDGPTRSAPRAPVAAPPPTEAAPRCRQCPHPREAATLADGFSLGRIAPHVDRYAFCALHYEERCIRDGRRLVVGLAVVLSVLGVLDGQALAPLMCAAVAAVLWGVIGLFLRSVRERIAERPPPPALASDGDRPS